MKRLIPPFLKKLDSYLLLNHPVVWISKIHFVVFYGIITWSLSALSGIAIPVNLSQTQDLGLWYFLFTILAIIALCFWLFHNIIFNLEKKFGKRHWTDEYKIFFLNVCCVFTFISFPIPFTSIYNTRVANTVSDEEFIKDINTLNAGGAFVINDLNNYSSEYDSIKDNSFYDLRKPLQFDSYTPWMLRYDTIRFHGLASSYQISQIYKTTKGDEQIKLLIKNYLSVWQKYDMDEYTTYSPDSLLSRSKYLMAHSPMTIQEFDNFYHTYPNTYKLEQIFRNIAEAKYRPLFIWDTVFLNFILYSCLYLSLLVMLFKMVPWKQFLLTLISFIIIPILLFIISQLLPYSSGFGRDLTYLVLMVLVLLTAIFFTALSALPSRQFNSFKNICAQITYLAAPLLPLIILFLSQTIFDSYSHYDTYNTTAIAAAEMVSPTDAYANTANNYYNSWPYIYQQLINDYWRNWFDHWLWISLYGGIILFVIAIMPLMKELFVKQLALPHKN